MIDILKVLIPVSKRDWHIESLDPSLEKVIGVFKVSIPVSKRDYDSESLDPVSIAKTQSRSSLVYMSRHLGAPCFSPFHGLNFQGSMS